MFCWMQRLDSEFKITSKYKLKLFCFIIQQVFCEGLLKSFPLGTRLQLCCCFKHIPFTQLLGNWICSIYCAWFLPAYRGEKMQIPMFLKVKSTWNTSLLSGLWFSPLISRQKLSTLVVCDCTASQHTPCHWQVVIERVRDQAPRQASLPLITSKVPGDNR